MLSIRNLQVGRSGRPVARAADANIAPSQAALLLGPSCSGESTALFTLAGLLAPLTLSVGLIRQATEDRLARDLADVDLVVGARGSPLQLAS